MLQGLHTALLHIQPSLDLNKKYSSFKNHFNSVGDVNARGSEEETERRENVLTRWRWSFWTRTKKKPQRLQTGCWWRLWAFWVMVVLRVVKWSSTRWRTEHVGAGEDVDSSEIKTRHPCFHHQSYDPPHVVSLIVAAPDGQTRRRSVSAASGHKIKWEERNVFLVRCIIHRD